MVLADANLEESRLCPACGYDLRASPSGRCPECGTEVGSGPVSRLPWVHRQYRGRRWGFLTTAWLVLMWPGELGRELRHRMSRGEAKHFWREAHALGTLVIAGMLTLAFLMRGPRLERWVLPAPAWTGLSRGSAVPVGPAYVLVEGLWCVVPLVVTAWVALGVTAALYRGLLWWAAGWGEGPRGREWRRRRGAVVGWYASAMLPLAGAILSLEAISIVAAFDLLMEAPLLWQWVVRAGILLLPAVAAWVLAYPTVTLLRRLGVGGVRAGLLTAGLVAVQVGVWAGAAVVSFWLLGFLSVLGWSAAN